MSLALAIAIGRKDYAEAIRLLRSGLTGASSDAEQLALVAHCHWWSGEEGKAIEVASEALKFNANCFEAHRVLSSLHAKRQDHRLGILHAQKAIRVFQATPQVPNWVGWLTSVLALLAILVRGRTAAAVVRRKGSNMDANGQAWLEWAREYVSWGERLGILTAANEPFRPAPRGRL